MSAIPRILLALLGVSILPACGDGSDGPPGPPGSADAWSRTGNSGTDPQVHFVGTTDGVALRFRVNDAVAFRLEPTAGGPNVVGGLAINSAAGGAQGATVSGGGTLSGNLWNTVHDDFGVIGGGAGNTAGVSGGAADEPGASVGGGVLNWASGAYSCVPGGYSNIASGDYSFAAGRRALTSTGCFTWADGLDHNFGSTSLNQFSARCTGGARFVSAVDGAGAPTAGVVLAAGGGSWTSLSDRNAKERFEEVDAREVLRKVSGLPVRTWSYRAQDPSIRHIGPTAQDFRAVFGVGESDTGISTVDADGVALSAIQGLCRELKDKELQLEAMRVRVASLERRLELLERSGREERPR